VTPDPYDSNLGGVSGADEWATNFCPCGCLRNSSGAHRGDCPDYESVRLVPHTNRPNEMTWTRRNEETR
jgi:hypothetical protein